MMKVRSGFVSNSSSSSFVIMGYKFDDLLDMIRNVYDNVNASVGCRILLYMKDLASEISPEFEYDVMKPDHDRIEEMYDIINEGNFTMDLLENINAIIGFESYLFGSEDETDGYIYVGYSVAMPDGFDATITKLCETKTYMISNCNYVDIENLKLYILHCEYGDDVYSRIM